MTRGEEIDAMPEAERAKFFEDVWAELRVGKSFEEIGRRFNLCPCCLVPWFAKELGMTADGKWKN